MGQQQGLELASTFPKAGASDVAVQAHAKFATVHTSVCNHFNQERSLTSRDYYKANQAVALAEWRGLLVTLREPWVGRTEMGSNQSDSTVGRHA